jgi:two-component system LytT family response regulator
MIRALIVEDEAPARAKLRGMLAEQSDVEIVGDAADGDSAAKAIAAFSPDVLFLDIQIPGMNGLELAARLPGRSPPMVVFVTAHDRHAVAAFDVNAVDYLLKPYDRERLSQSLDRVRHRMRSRAANAEPLLVPVGDKIRPIDADAILWIEAEDNYVRIHTAAQAYFLRRTLQDVLNQLGEQRFARIHKSRAVSVAEVETLRPLPRGDVEIALRNGERLRMSRRFRHRLLTPG